VSRHWEEIDWIVSASKHEAAFNYQRYHQWVEENQSQKQMEEEVKKVSSIRKGIGWTEEGCMKRIASMPFHLYAILRRVDPEFGRNTPEGKKKFYRFLLNHPEFSVK